MYFMYFVYKTASRWVAVALAVRPSIVWLASAIIISVVVSVELVNSNYQ